MLRPAGGRRHRRQARSGGVRRGRRRPRIAADGVAVGRLVGRRAGACRPFVFPREESLLSRPAPRIREARSGATARSSSRWRDAGRRGAAACTSRGVPAADVDCRDDGIRDAVGRFGRAPWAGGAGAGRRRNDNAERAALPAHGAFIRTSRRPGAPVAASPDLPAMPPTGMSHAQGGPARCSADCRRVPARGAARGGSLRGVRRDDGAADEVDDPERKAGGPAGILELPASPAHDPVRLVGRSSSCGAGSCRKPRRDSAHWCAGRPRTARRRSPFAGGGRRSSFRRRITTT